MPARFGQRFDLIGLHVREQRLGLKQRPNVVRRFSFLFGPVLYNPGWVRKRDGAAVKFVPDVCSYYIADFWVPAGVIDPVFQLVANAGIIKAHQKCGGRRARKNAAGSESGLDQGVFDMVRRNSVLHTDAGARGVYRGRVVEIHNGCLSQLVIWNIETGSLDITEPS